MLKHQLFDGWQVLIDNFILIIQKKFGEIRGAAYENVMTPPAIGA